MPDEVESNGGEVSDAMSENDLEYDENDASLKDDDKMADNALQQESGPDGEVKKKYDPKDPMRPRRKKARRACFACQRAHLTCGDERPCQRCIKRGLADHCQDGVRKKAKYLHDAPPEALRPVLGPNYNPNAPQNRPSGQRHPSSTGSEASSNVGGFFSPTTASNPYPLFSPQSALGPISEGMAFASQQSPVSPSFQTPQMSGLTVPQVSGDIAGMASAFFDPTNPALYNFNLEGLNFGSQYGAMEFGMLNQMSSGAADTSPRDPASFSQQGTGDANFSAGAFNNGMGQFDGGMMGDILSIDQSGNPLYNQGNLQHGLPHAYAIAAGPNNTTSPSTDHDSPQTTVGFEGPQTTTPFNGSDSQILGPAVRPKGKPNIPKTFPQSLLAHRQRDASGIYENVKDPFQYVQGFHRLIAFLQKRFRTSGDKLVRIAQALGSFRPSLLSCTRTLNRADLVFMEKCFQRTLFEYEDFMNAGSSPTIVCRRTGEIAAVNKEFTALTGWPKQVLLGDEPNRNVNTGGSAGGSGANTETLTTPKLNSLNNQNERGKTSDSEKHPLFIAELMDDDSVVQFYEDFAHLAFSDSRSAVTRKCRLLKYRTPETMDAASNSSVNESPPKDPRTMFLSNRVARIDGEHGIARIAKGGKLECTYVWNVRRDTFDMPMMMIINFLPCYYPDQQPHGLAV
ncbi:Transcriptional regulator of nonfermentable carbon utilization [Gnomoniopsis sp. IMI 355080]|nr:Transcriptional regulator of nonfermentable carbon utilization [Gnomoniopsis sp. IMI 355080]